MADETRFSAAELDRLEAGLEDVDAALAEESSEAVGARLGAYRDILALSREALPLVDVPAGVRAAVLAQAREAVEVRVLAADDDSATRTQAPSRSGRRWAIFPGVAVLAAAAMVLILVNRYPRLESRQTPSPEAATVARGEPAPASPPAASAPSLGDEAIGSAVETKDLDDDRVEDSVPHSAPTLAPELEPSIESRSSAVPAGAAGGPARGRFAKADAGPRDFERSAVQEESRDEGRFDRRKTKAEPKSSASPAAKPLPDTPTDGAAQTPALPSVWQQIAVADAARRAGKCSHARDLYSALLSDPDPKVRARAHAGIGLCAAKSGAPVTAESSFREARREDPEVAAFIAQEETQTPRSKRASSKTKKASPEGPKE